MEDDYVKLPRIGVKYAKVTITAKLADGTVIPNLPGVDMAVLAQRSTPSQATVWTAATWVAGGTGISGVATVLLAGPLSVVPGNAVLVAEPGCDLWARVTDTPEIDASFIDHIDLV